VPCLKLSGIINQGEIKMNGTYIRTILYIEGRAEDALLNGLLLNLDCWMMHANMCEERIKDVLTKLEALQASQHIRISTYEDR